MTAPVTAPAFEDKLPPRRAEIAMLADAMSELNRTPDTASDEKMARAFQRILAARGLKIVEARHVR